MSGSLAKKGDDGERLSPRSGRLAEEKRNQMAYKITVENNVLRLMLSDRLTGRDFEDMVVEARNYEQDVEVVPHRITDMTRITEMAIHYPDISAFAEKRRQLRFLNRFKSAIIATNEQHVGYARMFQTLNDNPQIAIRIFPYEASASRWVASPGNFERK